MRKTILSTVSIMLVAAVAIAANVHFIGSPKITENGNRSLTVCGTLAGLGNQDVTVEVSATASTTCTNRGSNDPPGLKETVSGSVSNLHPENGSVKFCATTSGAGDPCPKPMRPSTTFSDVVVKVYQGGRLVLQQSL
jgi:hypothetical protein